MRILVLVLAVLASACSSFPRQSAYETKIGFQPLVIELAKPTTDGTRFRMTGAALEGATIHGVEQPDGAGYRLTVTGVDWFHNWTDGWSEASFLASGELTLERSATGWKATVVSPPTLDEVQKASIRLTDDYFFGDQALQLFSHRWDRIQAAVPVVLALGPADAYESLEPQFRWEAFRWTKNFEESVRQRLFPEVYGYPAGTSRGKDFTRGESIAWDVTYTHEHFPQELWDVRQSGTLFRDFEEAPALWKLAVQWKVFWESQVPSTVFQGK